LILAERYKEAMIKMRGRRKTKSNEMRRKSRRRKHIREKGEMQVGACTKKMKVYIQVRK
jgi:hypothetical protein